MGITNNDDEKKSIIVTIPDLIKHYRWSDEDAKFFGIKNNPNEKQPLLKVFLCHASEDKPKVRRYYKKLIKSGYIPWIDEKDIIPGKEWELDIPDVIKKSDIVIVFLNPNSISKTGYFQKEIRIALDAADERPEGTIFIIPARLEDCIVPERLKKYQWIDLYKRGGYNKLLESLKEREKSLEKK